VIRNNFDRKGKELWTSRGRGDPVMLYTARDENDEATFIAGSILTNYSHGMQWRDHAVLYRMNAQSSQLEFALKRSGIPYKVIGGARFFDRAEVKDILSYLCVVSDPKDELRLLRIINTPPRGIGDKSIETARSISAEFGIPMFDVLEHADSYQELSRSALRMRQFASMIRELQDEKLSCDELYDRILEKTGYLNMLEQAKDERDQNRAENVRELKSSILSYAAESGDSSLTGYLSSIALYTDLDSMDRDDDYVVLMTIHSAKGLEFPVVYVIGMEESIFPGLRSIGEQEEMEEERRLCYVAITRAMKTLELLCAKERMIFGKTIANKVSRFVEEIPEEDIIKNIPKGYGWRERRNNGDSGLKDEIKREGLFYTSQRLQNNKPAMGFAGYSLGKKTDSEILTLNVGDKVKHRSFQEGVVIKMTPMGNDFLLEIDFMETGSKKLMLRAASRYMEKI